ncbi:MAG: hypothetical protein P4L51_00610 [Puia sp.]|nr:hypothetical protein [Puia sp.]
MKNNRKTTNAVYLAFFILLATTSRAQVKSYGFSAGIEYALSTYSAAGPLSLSGQGIFVQGERFFSRQHSGKTNTGFSGTLNLGWLHFSGTVYALDSSVQTRFSVLPLLAGARYYWKEHYYLAMQAGALVSTNSQTDTHLALTPGIGMIAPVGESLLELSLQFTGVPRGFGLPEKTVLQRGGYSFAALRIAYKF